VLKDQTKDSIIPFTTYESQLDLLKERYKSAYPFPHIVFNDFLIPEAAETIIDQFPSLESSNWIHYVHFNERKHGLNKVKSLPLFIQHAITQLNSKRFVNLLSELTGIPNLIADETLEGGGLHQSENGGYLNIHADYTVHPHRRKWRRRINVLIYLNRDWKDSFGGKLELWSSDMKKCIHKINPSFNKCVIFNTNMDSYHGHPDPLNCPSYITRKSIALYYFTIEDRLPKKRSTNYRASPEQINKRVFIYLDKKLLWLYNEVKGLLGLDDKVVSNILGFISSFWKKTK